MSIHDPNPALAAITAGVRALGDGWWGDRFRIVKVMPPDAFLAELPNGTRWIVSAYKARSRDE